MKKEWIDFAGLFGDSFIELTEEEYTVTITLAKNKIGRTKYLQLNEPDENEIRKMLNYLKTAPLTILQENERASFFGKWIKHPDEYEICATEFDCSICHESFCTNEMDDSDFIKTMKYCPNCGAKME